jgi:SSS family solute:Na+ symporter
MQAAKVLWALYLPFTLYFRAVLWVSFCWDYSAHGLISQGLNIGIAACIIFTAWAFLTSTKIGLGDQKHILLTLENITLTQHKYMLGVYSHFVVIMLATQPACFSQNLC